MYATQGYPQAGSGYTQYPPSKGNSYMAVRVIGGLILVCGIVLMALGVTNIALTWQVIMYSGGTGIWEGLLLIMAGAFGLSVTEKRMREGSMCNMLMTFMVTNILNSVLFLPGIIVVMVFLELPLYIAVSFIEGGESFIDTQYAEIQYILVYVMIGTAGLAWILSIVGACLVCCGNRRTPKQQQQQGYVQEQLTIPRAKYPAAQPAMYQPQAQPMYQQQPQMQYMQQQQPAIQYVQQPMQQQMQQPQLQYYRY